jgi:hypothetical protein
MGDLGRRECHSPGSLAKAAQPPEPICPSEMGGGEASGEASGGGSPGGPLPALASDVNPRPGRSVTCLYHVVYLIGVGFVQGSPLRPRRSRDQGRRLRARLLDPHDGVRSRGLHRPSANGTSLRRASYGASLREGGQARATYGRAVAAGSSPRPWGTLFLETTMNKGKFGSPQSYRASYASSPPTSIHRIAPPKPTRNAHRSPPHLPPREATPLASPPPPRQGRLAPAAAPPSPNCRIVIPEMPTPGSGHAVPSLRQDGHPRET